MKLMPASRALAMIRPDVASSVGPPNIMVPRQIGEIFRPLRPRERYCIGLDPITLAASFLARSFGPSRNGAACLNRLHAAGNRPSAAVLQYLEHAIRGDDDAILGLHLDGDENQAAGDADHARLGGQD